MRNSDALMALYRRLHRAFGPQGWWPGDSPFDIMVGAILTQNTAWTNAEKAIAAMKAAGIFSPRALARASPAVIARAIVPSGYYNQKARTLEAFMSFFRHRYGLDAEAMKKDDAGVLRPALLTIRGIGPETADSILLYALEKPVFVVDAYTFRILSRHGLVGEESSYEEMQSLFMDALPHDTALFNEFHALLVRTGKDYCRKIPRCRLGSGAADGRDCPLETLL